VDKKLLKSLDERVKRLFAFGIIHEKDMEDRNVIVYQIKLSIKLDEILGISDNRDASTINDDF
jgi:hypothetical protein